MKKSINLLVFCVFLMHSFAQQKQTTVNNYPFESVFNKLKSGDFEGTINGLLILENRAEQETLLDFQGTKASLNIEHDPDEMYDVSRKNYHGKTTSGKSEITYSTYNYANELVLKLPIGTFKVGMIDGASDEKIKGLKYHYALEKDTEYLILRPEKEIILIGQNGYLKLMPNSTITIAIKRNK
jgi:hypothetical protein